MPAKMMNTIAGMARSYRGYRRSPGIAAKNGEIDELKIRVNKKICRFFKVWKWVGVKRQS